MKLTFNLEELFKLDFRGLDMIEFSKYIQQPVADYKNFIKPKERERFLKSTIRITSSEIVKFLENTLGIELDREYNNHKRNQLNSLIKKIAPTRRGKRTVLDGYQFRNLILLDEFNKFVLNNFNSKAVKSEEEMYKEIMFLQQNKFKETDMYKAQKFEDSQTVGYALTLINGLAEFLKEKYCLFLYLWENNIFYGDIQASKEDKELLDIISYRFRQTNPLIYKFDSESDVNTTNNQQLIRFFVEDIDAWSNEVTDRRVSKIWDDM